jgi:isopentenyl-diphosphate Delta-isomerase
MITEVVLVDELDNQTGVMEKMEAHEKALLHRAFSVFIFSSRGDMLLQRRAAGKYHSAGLWTNACCSHPLPGEPVAAAAARRLQEEMGFVTPLTKAFHFVYKAAFDNGLTEYEFDHVFTGVYDGEVRLNPAEADDYCYRSMAETEADMRQNGGRYTEWFKIAFPKLQQWLLEHPLPAGNLPG